MKSVAGILLLLSITCVSAAGMQHEQQCVILLHGLGRTSLSMEPIASRLRAAGYCVYNKGYPSRDDDIDWLAASAIGDALAFCERANAQRIHFVTHSMGGILVRQYLQEHRIEGLQRIIMLSPPNQGSEVADLLRDNYLYRLVTGPAGQQLGTGPDSIVAELAPVPGEIGIITGSSSFDPWFSQLIPGADDGKVSITSAQLAEMQDFLVVEDGHTFIMYDNAVIGQILQFLDSGRFIHKTTQTAH